MRAATVTLWKVFSSQRALLTIVNGTCNNFGNGIALMTKYPGLKDTSEFVHDGPAFGLTPTGGMTHLLARPETTLKYPGVAEYVMLTGHPLYAGDALRLGWSDLFTTLRDMDFHVREWFDDTEHMHNDAVAWQIGHLLDSCFKMAEHHTVALERCALTPTRARWVEEAFADQPSVEAIMATLSAIEKLPLSDANNTTDAYRGGRVNTLDSVADAVRKLRHTRLSYNVSGAEAALEPREFISTSEIFQRYYFGRVGDRLTWFNTETAKAREWRAQRDAELLAMEQLRLTPHARHVFVSLEGVEHKRVDFEFDFVEQGPDGQPKPVTLDESNREELLGRLKQRLNEALGFDASRELSVHWQLPTMDTAKIFSDAELIECLHADPSVEDPARATRLPPIYLVVSRDNIHFSEWAYAVKHQLLLSCPFALKASFALLQRVRGDGAAENVMSVSETLATEYRYAMRTSQREDFYAVGRPSVDGPAAEEEKAGGSVADDVLPLRAAPRFDEIFERDVTVDGHTFKVRPRWSPRTLAEVSDADVAALAAPLDFVRDGLTDIHVPTEATMAQRVASDVMDHVGYELVSHLGSDHKDAPKPLVSNAKVPTNVDFYQMARHPFKDQATSWRSHGFTEGSMQYFRQKYDEAVKEVHDPAGDGSHHYWPQGASRAGDRKSPEPEEALLRDRFWGAVEDASKSVENWATEAALKAKAGKLDYQVEVPTSEEKIYDDHYYRWFIKTGVSPNPSGILKPLGGKSKQQEE